MCFCAQFFFEFNRFVRNKNGSYCGRLEFIMFRYFLFIQICKLEACQIRENFDYICIEN